MVNDESGKSWETFQSNRVGSGISSEESVTDKYKNAQKEISVKADR